MQIVSRCFILCPGSGAPTGRHRLSLVLVWWQIQTHTWAHVHCMWLAVVEHLNQWRLTIHFFVFLLIASNNSWYCNCIIYLWSPSSVCLFKALILCSHSKGMQWNCILCFSSWIFLSLFVKIQDLFVFPWAPKRQTRPCENHWNVLRFEGKSRT